ncbi:MAG TPA: hypothetical protein VFU22_27505 [Roseiflexaceae bacterium]|nr:hypothetical protein [Roseiflexaceae bacterium]
MPRRQRLLIVLLAAALALGCAACGPEAARPRGGGPGADGGNKQPTVVPRSKVFSAEHP